MNFSITYEKLIAHAKANPPTGYCEVHHIVPKCLGGGNEQTNLVALSARQHFVAHLLLAKIHGGNLIHAAFRMSKKWKYNSREYEWLRRAHADRISKLNKDRKYGPSKLRGFKHSDAARSNMSVAQKEYARLNPRKKKEKPPLKGRKGRPSPIKGRTFGPRKKRKSQASRDQMRDSMKALWIKRHAEGFKQAAPRPRSAESNAKISAKKMGHEVSPETREKIRLAVLANIEKRRADGYKYPKNRKSRSPEQKAKDALSARGHKVSPEARAKIGAAVRNAAIRRRANAAIENEGSLT